MSRQKNRLCTKIQARLDKTVSRNKKLKNALLLVHSEKNNIHWKFAAGTSGPKHKPIDADNPYHIASIGKTFTSVLIARLCERGKISFDDPVSKYLPADMLSGLFVYRGTDYAGKVLVRHLLNHTSGIGDYYEGKPLQGKPIKQLLVEGPGRFWTPDETIAYTRDNQKPVAAPGQKFHYSDTGYNLLGKLIENITGKALHENLHDEILTPLGMDNSCLLFYSEPKEKPSLPLAETYIGGHEVSTYKSISLDWAGGGIVSTTEDLLRFHKALVTHQLIKKETLAQCLNDTGRFSYGMDYGYGILCLNVGTMTLVLPKSFYMWGNFGSIASYMFYNPVYDTYIIGTFNHTAWVVRQVFFIIDIMRKVRRIG